MMEDELIKIWQSSSSQERLKFEKSKLMLELQSGLGRLNGWWKYRVQVEIVAAMIAIPAFALIAFWVPFTTSKIASALIIIYVIYVIMRLLSIKKFKPRDLEENYLEYLKKSREYLEAQRHLLETYNYWGALPLYPLLFLFLMGFWEIPSKRDLIIIVYLGMVAIHIYGYFLNMRRVKNEIMPRINRIDELIESLEE